LERQAGLYQPANCFGAGWEIVLPSAPFVDLPEQVGCEAHLKSLAEHSRNLRNFRLTFKVLRLR
jgi:hypothetical protein